LMANEELAVGYLGKQPPRSARKADAPDWKGVNVANLIWTIISILFVIWLIGLLAHFGGSLINLLLVIVVIGIIYNLVTGRRPV